MASVEFQVRLAVGVFCALGFGGCLASDDEAVLDQAVDNEAGVGGAAVEAAQGTLRVSPEVVDFGRVLPVPVGSGAAPASLTLSVSNVGAGRLDFSSILFNGSRAFQARVGGQDEAGPLASLRSLEPGASVDVVVTVAPDTQGPRLAELRIGSSDPERPEVVVPLQANATGVCATLSPLALDFEASRLRRSDNRSLHLASCGGDPLRIESLELTADTDPAFTLDAETVADLPRSLPEPTPEVPDPGLDLVVTFAPVEAREHTGALRITTNDPQDPVVEVPLQGRGVENACPVAVATPTMFEVPAYSVVVLDGSLSFDPSPDPDHPEHRGQLQSYQWVITERPEGSTSQPKERLSAQDPGFGPPDDAFTPVAEFFVDLVGHYTAELRVVDDEGVSSDSERCRTSAIVTIVSLPPDAPPE